MEMRGKVERENTPHIFIHVCTHTHAHTHIYIYVYVYIYTHTYAIYTIGLSLSLFLYVHVNRLTLDMYSWDLIRMHVYRVNDLPEVASCT